jgi:putative ABC transport system permease protein
MTWLRRRSKRSDDDHVAEMRDHVDQLAEQLVAQGRSPEEARREARLTFGNPRATLEQIRDGRWRRVMDTLRRDLRTAVRGLAAARGFTVVVLAVLTLAMTSLTVMFALVDGVMLRPLPFPDADRLVTLGRQYQRAATLLPSSPAEFLGLRSRTDVFEGLAATTGMDVVLRRDGDQPAEFLPGQRVSAEFFDVLGVHPVIGRAFTTDNEVEGRHRVAVVSHGVWQGRFGGRPDVIGRTLNTSNGIVEVTGVMPPDFEYPVGRNRPNELWMPYVIPASERVGRQRIYLRLVGRLRQDVSIEAATTSGLTESADAAVGPQSLHPGPFSLMDLHYSQAFQVRQWMWMLLAAVGCVWALAAVNIANLLAVRSTVRSREWALRVALGATRWDVARLVMLESLLLALAGAAAGVVAGWMGVEALRPLLPANLPRVAGVSVDARTLAVTVGAAVAFGLLAGLAPLWQARHGLRAALARDTRGMTASRERLSLRGILLAAEVALAIVLVLAGGMFLISFARVTGVDLGINTENVLVAHVRPGAQGLHQGPAEAGLARLEELASRVGTLPGVQSVSLVADNLPLSGSSSAQSIRVPSYAPAGDTTLVASITRVSPAYFSTLGVRTLRGRGLDASDRDGAPPVVVLSERAARAFFPGRDPVGEIVDTGQPHRVVGIVADVRGAGPENEVDEVIYTSLAQSPSPGAFMLVRVAPGQTSLAVAVNSAIRDAYPDMALVPVLPYADYLAPYVAQRRFNMIVIGVFAALGLAVACIGVHGVTAYVVVQRTKEIGIRRALGGGVATVIWAVLRGTTAQVVAGIGLGVAASLYLAAFAGEFLFEVAPRDPWLYTGAAALFAACALVSAVAPARRAARIDPATVLRLE